MMELWATGFNGLGQIQKPSDIEAANDIWTLTRIAHGANIEVLYAGWAQTVLLVDQVLQVLGVSLNGTLHRGHPGGQSFSVAPGSFEAPFRPTSAAGLESDGLQAFTGIFGSTQRFYILLPSHHDSIAPHRKSSEATAPGSTNFTPSGSALVNDVVCPQTVFAIAMTSSGTTAVIFSDAEGTGCTPGEEWFDVAEFGSFTEFLEQSPAYLRQTQDGTFFSSASSAGVEHIRKHRIPGRPKRLCANALSFVLLTEEGMVWTWARESRYAQALGRDTSGHSKSATSPGMIEQLVGLHIVHIAVGSWMTGAVSNAGEAWIWGCDAPGSYGENQNPVLRRIFTQLKECNVIGHEDEDFLVPVRLPVVDEARSTSARRQPPIQTDDTSYQVEIKSMDIGEEHILILDANGAVWCFGSNDKGQLGFHWSEQRDFVLTQRGTNSANVVCAGADSRLFKGKWKQIEFPVHRKSEGWEATKVICGDFTSFVLLEKVDT